MLMMLIVDMAVLMPEPLMHVDVGVPGSKEGHDTGDHEQQTDTAAHRESLMEKRHRNECAGEGRGGKERRFPGRTQQPQSVGVEENAHAIAEETQQQSRASVPRGGEALAEGQGDEERTSAGAERLHPHDCNRIFHGNALGQIVVDAPTEAGAGDGKRADGLGPKGAGLVSECRSAGNDERRREHFEAAHVLAENCDGEQHREHCLEIQKE